MNIDLFVHDVTLAPNKRENLESWLMEAMSYATRRIEHLEVRITRPTGDLHACRLDATLVPHEHIHVEAEAPELHDAASHAVERMRWALQRAVERRRSKRQRNSSSMRDIA